MPDQTSKLRINEQQVGDSTVLTLCREMRGDDGDLAFGRRVDELIKQGRVQIVVNLAEVTNIDSSGVGMMVAKLKMVQQKGGAMKLANLTARSYRQLAMLKIGGKFDIFEDEASAVRSFAWRKPSSP
jgi:anti-sigma B factor antagonist